MESTAFPSELQVLDLDGLPALEPSLGPWRASLGAQIDHGLFIVQDLSLWSSVQLIGHPGWILPTLGKGMCGALEKDRNESQRKSPKLSSHSEKP